MENTTICSASADGTGACSLAGVVAGGEVYSIESGVGYTDDGTDNGTRDFNIDSDGLITVVGKPSTTRPISNQGSGRRSW